MNRAASMLETHRRPRRRSLARRLGSASPIALAAALAAAAHAADWTGAISDDWSDPLNWQGGVLPTIGENIYIETAGAAWPVINGGTYQAAGVTMSVYEAGATLTIKGGGKLNLTEHGDVGLNFAGSATVTGAGSQWNIGKILTLGYYGDGTLTLSNNGLITSRDGYLGGYANSRGRAFVTSGGQWNISQELFIGYGDSQGDLRISAGGKVTALKATLGFWDEGVGYLSVDGAGSLLDAQAFIVGRKGQGSAIVLNGGRIDSASGLIAEDQGSQGGVVVTGSGSQWNSASAITVGAAGNGLLQITLGGIVHSAGAIVGREAGSNGSVLVSQSSWVSPGDVVVGDFGNGTVVVTSGAALTSQNAVIGDEAGSTGEARIAGVNTQWIAVGDAVVGRKGDGKLRVEGAAKFIATSDLKLGAVAGALGVVELSGAVTRLSAQSAHIGMEGEGRLTIEGGAALDTLQGGFVGGGGVPWNTGTGEVLITGAGSVWNTGSAVTVGEYGAGLMRVEDGGVVNGHVRVGGFGTLSGDGTVRAASILDGGTLIGVQGQTLTVSENLVLSGGAHVEVALGAPGNGTGLFNVVGDLTLDGTLNVANAGGFGAGIYRIFDYGGALTDNGMEVGAMPAGTSGTIQTAVAHQVNLLVEGMTGDIQFWNGATTTADGIVHGGAGVWSVGPATNWTDVNGAASVAWGGHFAIFQNDPAAVTVDGAAGAVVTTGMQFIGTGWTVGGDALTLDGAGGDTAIRVGDGTMAGAAHTATIAAALVGGSRLVKDDLGTLILTGANGYAGGTRINAGILQIGNGGAGGSILGPVENNGTLVFNRSDAFALAGTISGSGTIRQIGAGLVSLTGVSSGFSGDTRVENGALAVDGVLGGTVDVLAGGRLQGVGTVGDVRVGGTIAPGNSIGTLTVAGNIVFDPGSVYEVEIDADGQADRILADGTATLGGGRVSVLAGVGGYAPATTYTILTAHGGLSGTFTGGVTSNLAFLDPSLSYDANNVYLTMTRNDVDFSTVGLTPNQIATGSGVESLGFGDPVWNAVLNLSADQAQYAFDQLSGEAHVSARTAMLEDSRFLRRAVNDRMRAASGGGEAAIWAEAFGARGHADSDGNAARLDRSVGGAFVGVDAPVSDTWRLGAVAGYSRATFKARDRHASGTRDSAHVGVYGGAAWGALALRMGAAYAWHDIATDRTVAFPGFSDALKADYDAGTAQAFGELGYAVQAGRVALEPFANLAHVSLHAHGFTETGGAAALSGPSADAEATFTTLGLRAAATFEADGAALTVRGLAGWRHTFGDATPLAAMRFASGGDAFVIGGVPLARDAALLEAGLDVALSPSATLGVSYGGQFGSGVTDQSVRAVLNVRF